MVVCIFNFSFFSSFDNNIKAIIAHIFSRFSQRFNYSFITFIHRGGSTSLLKECLIQFIWFSSANPDTKTESLLREQVRQTFQQVQRPPPQATGRCVFNQASSSHAPGIFHNDETVYPDKNQQRKPYLIQQIFANFTSTETVPIVCTHI